MKVLAKIRDESKLIVGIFERFKISHSNERLAMFFVIFLFLWDIRMYCEKIINLMFLHYKNIYNYSLFYIKIITN